VLDTFGPLTWSELPLSQGSNRTGHDEIPGQAHVR
jgi:hypothetical protein